MRTHKKHSLRIIGSEQFVDEISGETLQSYVNQRSREFTHFLAEKSDSTDEKKRTRVSGATIRKELVTLGTVWRWAESAKLVSQKFPNQGLRFPKTDEKPPFQTWDEIERQIGQSGLSEAEANSLWSCLYLRDKEIQDLLLFARENANHSFIYPMLAVAAYTGVRRSELIRSTVSDFDLKGRLFTVRERKRVKGKRSFRRVPISNRLFPIIQEWLESKEDSPFTFSNFGSPITRNQAHNHFRQTVAESRWGKIKGWHCLRHSFISNLACKGVDQRIIDDFVGHTSEEMRRRYRHLFPDVKEAAINKVFG